MAGFDDLTEAELAAVVWALRETIDRDRYSLSPRMAPFKTALAKLDPASAPKPAVERKPLPEAPARSRGGRRTRRRIGARIPRFAVSFFAGREPRREPASVGGNSADKHVPCLFSR